MQMKKNYLLLFLIALLFGTATMRGQGNSGKGNPLDAGIEYYVKIGKGYLNFKKLKFSVFTCVANRSDASVIKSGASSTESTFSITGYSDNSYGTLQYTAAGAVTPVGAKQQQFENKEIGGKYYLRATEVTSGSKVYLTNKNGKLSLEETPSEDAVFEYEGKNGNSKTEVAENLKKMLNRLSFFQAHRYVGSGDTYYLSPFLGSGLGQYPHPIVKDRHDKDEWKYFSFNMYRKSFEGLDGDGSTESAIRLAERCEKALHINTPQAGTYVVISTKSQYEDKIRENDGRSSELNFTPGSAAGPSQPAKYLQATATGYQLTTTKAEASVFYFDGNHLTGLDYGFGLNTTQNKYDLTEDAQKAVVAQGKLEKTLDAGSYSLKVGDKFVKLDNTGLNVTDNESESHIFLEEATKFNLTTNDLGYVTFYAPTAVKVPAGVKIFSGKLNASGTQVVFTEVSGNQIPAKTAVLLQKGTSKVTFEVEKIANASPITNNSLQGFAVSSSDRKNNAYGMMVENGKLVFKRLSDAVRAFRAVVYKGAAGSTQEFIPTSFAPTGIEGVTIEESKEEIFDLTGRRVESPVKGQVYIKGGKKFIQK